MVDDCCPRLIFLDLDGTVWSSKDISTLVSPFRVVGDELVDSKGVRVRLYSGVREFLCSMGSNGLPVYSLSWNHMDKALEALRAFGIDSLFAGHYIEPHPRKGMVMARALKENGHAGLKPCEIVYIDDRDIHLNDVRTRVGEVFFIQLWKDIDSYSELTELILSRRRVFCKQ